MSLPLDASFTPGICSRTTTPDNIHAAAAGAGVNILNMQKQPTTRIIVKVGTVAAAAPQSFTALSDLNITALGVTLGGNRNVRNRLPIGMHKQEHVEQYGVPAIQGYNVLDFIQSGSPDSAYPGDKVGAGTTFEVDADTAGAVGGLFLMVQEMLPYHASGPLYTF